MPLAMVAPVLLAVIDLAVTGCHRAPVSLSNHLLNDGDILTLLHFHMWTDFLSHFGLSGTLPGIIAPPPTLKRAPPEEFPFNFLGCLCCNNTAVNVRGNLILH